MRVREGDESEGRHARCRRPTSAPRRPGWARGPVGESEHDGASARRGESGEREGERRGEREREKRGITVQIERDCNLN